MASSSSPSGGSASNKPEAVSQLPISNTRSHQHEDMQVPTEAIPSPTRSNPWSESSSQTDVPFYSALQTPEDSISVASESFQSLYDEEGKMISALTMS